MVVTRQQIPNLVRDPKTDLPPAWTWAVASPLCRRSSLRIALRRCVC